jgi:4-aminobutyrate aminotransferase
MEHFGVIPDVITLSKAIANGLPLGITLYKEELESNLKPGEHYSTLGGNALSCVAAEVVLDELIGGLIEKTKRNGLYFKRLLESLKDRHELIGDVRGEGLFLGIELVKNRKTKEPAKDAAAKFLQEAWKRKVLVGLGGLDNNVVRIEPPLVITKEHIEDSVEAFNEALRVISK